MMNIYLTNLAAYNAGKLVGEWLEMPFTEEEYSAVMNRIGNPEETFITDYESDLGIKVGEYDSIFALNEQIKAAEGYDADLIAAIIECGYSLKDALDMADDVIFYPGMELIDVAYELVEECCDLPEIAQRYFDYEAFARDLGFDGYYETEYGVLYI